MFRRKSTWVAGAISLAIAVCLVLGGCGSAALGPVEGTQPAGDSAAGSTGKLQERFAKCSASDLHDLPSDTTVSKQSVSLREIGATSASAVSNIADIKQFLNTCPQNDPASATILSDFEIRKNGTLVESFPCTEPVSAMPVSMYTDELIALQGLRAIYYMDYGRSGHLPWFAGTMYEWMRSKIGGINFSSIGPQCCQMIDGKRFITIPFANEMNRDFDRTWRGISGNISLYSHEVRHVEGFPHTSCCAVSSGCDQAFDQSSLSAYGIQWWLNWAWLTGYIDVGYSCLSSTEVRNIANWHISACNTTFGPRFCDALPPLVEMPAYPGTQDLSGPNCGGTCVSDADCEDGVACNGSESCLDGACRPGVAPDCDDGVSCTVDACVEPFGSCTHTPSSRLCDDGDACTDDVCDASVGCVSTAASTCCGNQLCEAGESCTSCPNDCVRVAGAVCGNGLCEPGEDCTDQSCPEDCRGRQGGRQRDRYCCSGTPGGGGGANPVDCANPWCTSDGWACELEVAQFACCGNGVCEVGEDGPSCAVDCACTSDADCYDEDACTIDTCVGGYCGNYELDCDDGDVCTADICNASGACEHTSIPGCGCNPGGYTCRTNDDCCSGKCKNGRCRGN